MKNERKNIEFKKWVIREPVKKSFNRFYIILY